MTEIKNEKINAPVGAGDYSITVETPEGPKPVELSHDDDAYVQQKLRDYQRNAAQSMARINRQTLQAERQKRLQQKEQEEQLQSQRNEIAVDEARALDNEALSSALLGEKGGMQQARQKEIRTIAAKNRRVVNEAQKRLAEDTARATEQLRAAGEFEKAEALLDLNQNLERSLHDLLVRVAEGLLEPEEVEPMVQAMTASEPASAPTQTADAEQSAWDAVRAVGIQDASYETVGDLFRAGGLLENEDGTLSWANGWSPENYKELLDDWQREVQ